MLKVQRILKKRLRSDVNVLKLIKGAALKHLAIKKTLENLSYTLQHDNVQMYLHSYEKIDNSSWSHNII